MKKFEKPILIVWGGTILLLVVFGIWGELVYSILEPFYSHFKELPLHTQAMQILYFIVVILVGWKFKSVVEMIPNIILGIIIFYVLGWSITFLYSANKELGNNSDFIEYPRMEEIIYFFNGSINFLVIIATLISLYALMDERTKARQNKEDSIFRTTLYERMNNMEEPEKYEIKKDNLSTLKMEQIRLKFRNVGREADEFLPGDIIVTKENHLKRIGSDISREKAMELLKSRSVNAFYPIESQIQL